MAGCMLKWEEYHSLVYSAYVGQEREIAEVMSFVHSCVCISDTDK